MKKKNQKIKHADRHRARHSDKEKRCSVTIMIVCCVVILEFHTHTILASTEAFVELERDRSNAAGLDVFVCLFVC